MSLHSDQPEGTTALWCFSCYTFLTSLGTYCTRYCSWNSEWNTLFNQQEVDCSYSTFHAFLFHLILSSLVTFVLCLFRWIDWRILTKTRYLLSIESGMRISFFHRLNKGFGSNFQCYRVQQKPKDLQKVHCCEFNNQKICIFSSLTLFLFLFQQLPLKNGSESFSNWISPPVPVYFNVYVFNYTNAVEIMSRDGVRPHVKEMGPYVYK